jgi:hypothetical protein
VLWVDYFWWRGWLFSRNKWDGVVVLTNVSLFLLHLSLFFPTPSIAPYPLHDPPVGQVFTLCTRDRLWLRWRLRRKAHETDSIDHIQICGVFKSTIFHQAHSTFHGAPKFIYMQNPNMAENTTEILFSANTISESRVAKIPFAADFDICWYILDPFHSGPESFQY